MDKGIIKTISNNLKKYMERDNINQYDLLAALNTRGVKVSQTAISNWVNGTKAPRMDKIDALCDVFHVSRLELLYDNNSAEYAKYKNIKPVSYTSVPMLGSVACGKPIFINEEHQDYIEKPDGIKCDFCLTAKGDSMIDIGIQNNDIVFIKAQDTANNGDIVCVSIDDEATIKKLDYDRLNNKLLLIPCNKAYQTSVYEGEQLDHIHILGKVIYFKRYL